ncbi:MAG: hypothetical protein ABEH78_08715 [Haloferacaceae archaeon]
MTDGSTWANRQGSLVVGAFVAFLALVVICPASAAAQAATPSLDCVGSGGGAAYVTDSGLTVYENDSAIDFGNFTDAETVDYGNVSLSATGTADVRLEDGTGNRTCLGDVNAGATPITVDADDKPAVEIASNASGVVYRNPVYDRGNDAVDLAYNGSGTLNLTIESTGLAEGRTVVAEDADSGTELARGRVGAGGAVALTLPAGDRRADLRLASQDDDGGSGGSDGRQRSDVVRNGRARITFGMESDVRAVVVGGLPEGSEVTARWLGPLPDDVPDPDVITITSVEISAPDPPSGGATLEVTLSPDLLDRHTIPAERMTIQRYDVKAGAWQRLSTSAAPAEDGARLTATTDAFSVFAVTARPAATRTPTGTETPTGTAGTAPKGTTTERSPTPGPTPRPTSTSAPTTSRRSVASDDGAGTKPTGGKGHGFGTGVAALALLAAALRAATTE